ncbi:MULTISPECIES: hypothetical protein [unclassified Haladaptatus]|uniref:hypothetical protein n=1 Tax=unclassified Haladaptatus TaxID=2622732 RepID=UPI00209C0D00|nr:MULTISPECIES: hypothetical protein [unclassified Haladaptatus]MCO8246099.1 hypothetical protein [Haladaptatus sp. AB643]MCO8254281.1 hypothetical protein [Haladaptatus sp. AB618]
MKTRLASFAFFAPFAGVIIGLFPVSVLYLDGYWDLQLVAFIWATFAIAGWLAVRRRDVWRSRGSWWSALLVVVVLGGAQFGIHMDLPIPEDLTIALWYLVFGVGLASAAIGVEIGIEKGDDGVATDDDYTEQKSSSPTAD